MKCFTLIRSLLEKFWFYAVLTVTSEQPVGLVLLCWTYRLFELFISVHPVDFAQISIRFQLISAANPSSHLQRVATVNQPGRISPTLGIMSTSSGNKMGKYIVFGLWPHNVIRLTCANHKMTWLSESLFNKSQRCHGPSQATRIRRTTSIRTTHVRTKCACTHAHTQT